MQKEIKAALHRVIGSTLGEYKYPDPIADGVYQDVDGEIPGSESLVADTATLANAYVQEHAAKMIRRRRPKLNTKGRPKGRS